MSEEIKPYHNLKSLITEVENDLIYMGCKLIIPEKSRSKILDNLHTEHFGVTKCIKRALLTVYWPNINKKIEMLIKSALYVTNMVLRSRQSKYGGDRISFLLVSV